MPGTRAHRPAISPAASPALRPAVRSRFAAAVAALALLVPAGLASTAQVPTAGAGPLEDAVAAVDPTGALGPYIDEAVAGANGPLGDPGPPAAVAADVGCRPSPAHPRPVVLVHGTFDNGPYMMARLGNSLRAQGFCVVAPTLGAYAGNPSRGGLDSIAGASGPQLAGVIDHVRAVTGAPQVDLVGYSQGAAIAGYTTKVLRPGAVGRVVSVGGYWGSETAGLIPHALPPTLVAPALWAANLRGLSELAPGTPTVAAWYGPDRTPFLPGVGYMLIASRGDHLLPPGRSFVAGPGVGWRVPEDACGGGPVSHHHIVGDPRTHSLVSRALGGGGGCG